MFGAGLASESCNFFFASRTASPIVNRHRRSSVSMQKIRSIFSALMKWTQSLGLSWSVLCHNAHSVSMSGCCAHCCFNCLTLATERTHPNTSLSESVLIGPLRNQVKLFCPSVRRALPTVPACSRISMAPFWLPSPHLPPHQSAP